MILPSNSGYPPLLERPTRGEGLRDRNQLKGLHKGSYLVRTKAFHNIFGILLFPRSEKT